MAEPRPRLNTKAAGVVGASVLCSRLLGLIREVLFAGLFGAGRHMDAFFVAFRVPNLLRDLFAEGALSTAFITVFAKKIQQSGPDAAWPLAAKMATLTAVFMSLITLLGMLFSESLIGLMAPGFDAEKAALTVWLTRLMFPFILLVSLAALVMGMLNAREVFGIPAMASSFFNIGSILGGLGFGYALDPHFGPRALTGLALGTLLGGLLQLGIQLPSLRQAGFRFRLDFRWRDEGVGQVLHLMVPSVIAASAVQVNVMVNSIFASYLEDGAVSWLQFAFRLMQLPLGIFGVAIATVTLPVVSKMAALGDLGEFRETLGRALRLAVFCTVPSAVGLVVLAEPIIGLIYERGRFSSWETLRTAQALQCYALGLIGYSCIKVLAPSFYAVNRRWVPMMVSFGSIALNVALNYGLIFQMGLGHRGLALSTALSATANFMVLYGVMRRHLDGLETKLFLHGLLKCGLAAGLMAVVLVGAQAGFNLWLSPDSIRATLWVRATVLLGLILLGGGVFLLAAWTLRVGEMREAERILGAQAQRLWRKVRP